ncbi:MAG: tRNA uridine-5-carboxymethylaminomethyl(34) synthesis GTPase MnmE [Candidatus Rokuibacteriota bacterium]|nr:MAG: tRNA uridine-5-carboxymethylaminomethyl(34) synthesis GTPase MnmE [Candidatus Rokubacteria bacterium]
MVAVATAIGESAIGIIRVSGADAVAIVAPLLGAAPPLAALPSHALRRVAIVDPKSGERVDTALCTVMRSPRSYTGEDVVELSCHGSPALLRMIVQWLVAGGARLAAPGEFTRRAFLNGRLDLAQAEAVALMIGARTDRAVALAARALAGGFSDQVRGLQARLIDVIAGLEVTLDFPEEGVGHDVESARAAVGGLRAEAERWLEAARHGRVVHGGLTVALVGPPNAGKSSLLNALVGQDRAIVSDIPGTTRDVVEGTIVLAGVPVRLLDTAGIETPRDVIEAEGIRRSRRAIEESELLLVVLDGSVEPDRRVLGETAARPRVLIRAKSDLQAHRAAAGLPGAQPVSAVTGEGMAALRECLTREIELRAGASGDEGGIVASIRQIELLESLSAELAAAEAALADAPLEAALVDLNGALAWAGRILGVDVADAVLDRIFSAFCLGK